MGKVNGKDKASNVALWQPARRSANHLLHLHWQPKGHRTGNSFRKRKLPAKLDTQTDAELKSGNEYYVKSRGILFWSKSKVCARVSNSERDKIALPLRAVFLSQAGEAVRPGCWSHQDQLCVATYHKESLSLAPSSLVLLQLLEHTAKSLWLTTNHN